MLKDVLVHIDGSSVGAGRLAFAMDMADRYRAHLTVAHVMPPPEPPTVFDPNLVGRASEMMADRHLVDAAKAKTSFDRAVLGRNASARWRGLVGDVVPQLIEAARYADFVVLGQYEWQSPIEHHPFSVAEGVVLGCGRPVLVVPAAVVAASFRKALFAWDGSREAVRAVHDAIPLLHQPGSSIEIVTLSDDADAISIDLLKDHLKRHHIKAMIGWSDETNGTTGQAVAQRVKDGHFDLLIMGAFSRPAWLELLFGGTTSSALRQTNVPVLTSH